jgi:hypothetical protein
MYAAKQSSADMRSVADVMARGKTKNGIKNKIISRGKKNLFLPWLLAHIFYNASINRRQTAR